MRKTLIFITALILSGCQGGGASFKPNCAADGPNCKQYNPGLERGPNIHPPLTPAPKCAADGGGCKQFNPDL